YHLADYHILAHSFFLLHLAALISYFSYHPTATTDIYTLSLHDALPICPYRAPHRRGGLSPYAAPAPRPGRPGAQAEPVGQGPWQDRKSTRLNSSHVSISYAVFCLKKKKNKDKERDVQ